MNEKFGITLELITDKLNKKLEGIKELINNLSNTTRKSVVLEVDDTHSIESIKNLSSKLKELNNESKDAISKDMGIPFKFVQQMVEDSIE